MNLHDPERHVHPPPIEWDPARVRAWLACWSDDTLAERTPRGWTVHPRDASDFPAPPEPLRCLYFGAAGVWLALARAAAQGVCHLPDSLADCFARELGHYEHSPDLDLRAPSWLLGESALLTACCLTRPDPALAGRLADSIRGNRDNPTREMLWGAPGTMYAALFMHEATGDERWAELYRDSANALWSTWFRDDEHGAWVWEQDLYGSRVRYLGAGHGWAGNLHPLWRGRELLSAEQQSQLRERTLEGLTGLAAVAGERANWPVTTGPQSKWLVQWCHGAPGLLTSLRHADLPEALPLLLRCGALVVHAGPLVKGPGLCHGTAGNGAALLELHHRTGDPQWLAHARAFAMQALAQAESERERYGQWHHSLWTGDAGLACFLLDCLAGRSSGLPGLDRLW